MSRVSKCVNAPRVLKDPACCSSSSFSVTRAPGIPISTPSSAIVGVRRMYDPMIAFTAAMRSGVTGVSTLIEGMLQLAVLCGLWPRLREQALHSGRGDACGVLLGRKRKQAVPSKPVEPRSQTRIEGDEWHSRRIAGRRLTGLGGEIRDEDCNHEDIGHRPLGDQLDESQDAPPPGAAIQKHRPRDEQCFAK